MQMTLGAIFVGSVDQSENVLKLATQIKTPLMLAGLIVLILFLLFRRNLPKEQAYMVFTLALVAEVLGILCFGLVNWPSKVQAKSPVLDGTVFSPRNSTKGVPKATVYLAIPGHATRLTETQVTGYYAFSIDPADFGKQAQLYVIANGYKDSGRMPIPMEVDIESHDVWLDPDASRSAATTTVAQPNRVGERAVAVQMSGAPQETMPPQNDLQTCLSGQWKELLVGRPQDANPNIWSFSLSGDTLTVVRADNFAKMTLQRYGNDYKGDLAWGTGDVWHNIALTPSSDCHSINTNLQWSYIR